MYNGCEICQKFQESGIPVGYLRESSGLLKRCTCYTEYLEKVYIQTALIHAGVMNDFILDYDLQSDYIGGDSREDIVTKLIYFVKHFSDKFYNQSLYWHGEYGTQKTTIAFWLIREILKIKKANGIHYTAQYCILNNLLTRLVKRSSFSDGEELQDELTELLNKDFLVIDEFFGVSQDGKGKVNLYQSGWQIAELDSFLRERLDVRGKSTIFVSNTPVDSLEKSGASRDIVELITRKTRPDGVLYFHDCYIKKDDFDVASLWG